MFSEECSDCAICELNRRALRVQCRRRRIGSVPSEDNPIRSQNWLIGVYKGRPVQTEGTWHKQRHGVPTPRTDATGDTYGGGDRSWRMDCWRIRYGVDRNDNQQCGKQADYARRSHASGSPSIVHNQQQLSTLLTRTTQCLEADSPSATRPRKIRMECYHEVNCR
jgi:hypothetical protein